MFIIWNKKELRVSENFYPVFRTFIGVQILSQVLRSLESFIELDFPDSKMCFPFEKFQSRSCELENWGKI